MTIAIAGQDGAVSAVSPEASRDAPRARRPASHVIGPLRFALVAIAVVYSIAALHAIATHPMPVWTSAVIVVLAGVIVGGAVLVVRHPEGLLLEPLVILMPGLTIGRLLSTAWLVPAGQPAPRLNPLMLGETGPGITIFEPLTIVLAAAATLYIFAQARRSIVDGTGYGASDWLMATIRAYLGLMFISHFTGHVLAGPIPFGAFVGYFGDVGMPFPTASVILAGGIEITVCIGLAFGLLTRPLAILGTVYLLIAVGIGGHFSIGYSWGLPDGGWEFPALWAFAVAQFAVFGAGPISLDAKRGSRISKAG